VLCFRIIHSIHLRSHTSILDAISREVVIGLAIFISAVPEDITGQFIVEVAVIYRAHVQVMSLRDASGGCDIRGRLSRNYPPPIFSEVAIVRGCDDGLQSIGDI